MIYEGRSFFGGTLDGKVLTDFFINKYELETAEERIEAVEDLLDNTYFQEYFDKFFKVGLNGTDQLSSGINVCQTLEKLADYILNCKEVKEERKAREVEYRFYKNKSEFFERTKRECNGDDKTLDFLKEEGRNFYLSKNQVITKEDLAEDSECGRILREYNVMLEKCKQIPKFTKMLTQSKLVKEDMILTKNMLNSVVELSGGHGGKVFIDYDDFDWKNPNHVKEILSVHRDFNPEDNLSHILLALDTYVKEMYEKKILDKQQYLIVRLLRSGYNQKNICDMLEIKKSTLSHKIKAIVNKINKYAKN